MKVYYKGKFKLVFNKVKNYICIVYKNYYKESIKIFDLFFLVWFIFLFFIYKVRWSIFWGLDIILLIWGGYDMNIYEIIKNYFYWGNILGDV